MERGWDGGAGMVTGGGRSHKRSAVLVLDAHLAHPLLRRRCLYGFSLSSPVSVSKADSR